MVWGAPVYYRTGGVLVVCQLAGCGRMATSIVVTLGLVLCLSAQSILADIYVKRYYPVRNEAHSLRHFSSEYVRGTPLHHTDGLGGWLLYASPDATACSSIQRKLKNSSHFDKANNSISWILMAKAGNCSLGQKISMATKMGYSALIIHSFGSANALSLPSHVPLLSARALHVVAIDEDTAATLRNNFTFFNGKGQYVISISESSTESWFEAHFSPFFHTLSAICCAITVFILVRRFRESWSNRHKKGIGLKNVNAIPTREYAVNDQFEVCVICFENFQPGETLRVLSCEHMFHPACIDPWLSKRRNACPVCKRKAWRRPDVRSKKGADLKPGEALAEEASEEISDDISDDMSSDELPEGMRGII